MIWPLQKKAIAKCGHFTKRKDKIFAFDEECEIEILGKDQPEFCHRCLEKMTIRCAWCGKPIFIGDIITLYSPSKKNKQMPEYALVHDVKTNSFVGCGRTSCADSGCDYCGYWGTKGVIRFPSIAERVMSSGQVLVGNPTDPASIHSLSI